MYTWPLGRQWIAWNRLVTALHSCGCPEVAAPNSVLQPHSDSNSVLSIEIKTAIAQYRRIQSRLQIRKSQRSLLRSLTLHYFTRSLVEERQYAEREIVIIRLIEVSHGRSRQRTKPRLIYIKSIRDFQPKSWAAFTNRL